MRILQDCYCDIHRWKKEKGVTKILSGNELSGHKMTILLFC